MRNKLGILTILTVGLILVPLISLTIYHTSFAASSVPKQMTTGKTVKSSSPHQLVLNGTMTTVNLITNQITTGNIQAPLVFKAVNSTTWTIYLPKSGAFGCAYDGTNDGQYQYNKLYSSLTLHLTSCGYPLGNSTWSQVLSISDNPLSMPDIDLIRGGYVSLTGYMYIYLHGSAVPLDLISIIGNISPWPPQ